MRIALTIVLFVLLLACSDTPQSDAVTTDPPTALQVPPPMLLRVATFNVSLHGRSEGDLLRRLDAGDADARRIAAVIQRQRPDLLLLNEFDYDQAHAAADRFQRNYLEVSQFDQAPIPYPYRFLAPVNTGVLSGLDLNGDGKVALPEDGWGFGNYPGQYGMLVLSRYPIDVTAVRTFQKFAWSSMPGALMPRDPAHNAPYYPEPIWTQLRLSSKSHWDIPIDTPGGRLHFLVSHPTPPVFDGPENRNGLRNHDEIRFWADYVSDEPQQWLLDDAGGRGGLDPQARFVIAGDQNADPVDGDTVQSAILQLIEHPRVLRYSAPRSAGGARSGEMASGVDLGHRGPHAHDTGSFGARTGNLRVDYVLPSREFAVAGSGVFWPLPEEPEADWLKASDHRMVWLDLKPAEPGQ